MTTATERKTLSTWRAYGPFASLRTLPDGRQVWSLSAEGKRLVERHLAKYPQPALILWRKYPRLARRTLRPTRDPHLTALAHQAARYGVVRAALRFDPSRGTKFSTFVVPHIAAQIQNLFRRRRHEPATPPRPLRVTSPDSGRESIMLAGPAEPDGSAAEEARRLLDLAGLAANERAALELRYGIRPMPEPRARGCGLPPTYSEIGKAIGVSTERVRQLIVYSLDRLREVARLREADRIRADAPVREETRQLFDRAGLNPKQRHAVELRLGIRTVPSHRPGDGPPSYVEIGKSVGVTRQSAKHLVTSGLDRLRRAAARRSPILQQVDATAQRA